MHKSVQSLEADIRAWVDTWNEVPIKSVERFLRQEAISLASARLSAPRRRRRKASRSGTGTSTAAVARTCPAWPRRSIPRSRWLNYYGAFYRSELCFLALRINEHLVRWAKYKFKRFRGKYAKAITWLQKVYQYKPGLFAHWQLIAFT